MNEPPHAGRVPPDAGPGWPVGVRRGPAATLHGLVPDGSTRVAEWYEVERPALVLGSAQRDDVVDRSAAADAGVDVVRRRSGGGVVLLMPGESLWLDVVVPRRDPRWDDDVAAAMWWLGDVWCEALHAVGAPTATVHRGALVHTPWSRLVCFDGLGSGEVLVDGRKAVGISQRRTRDWVRLQSSIHLAWQGDLLVSLLAPPAPTVDELRPPAVHLGDAVDLRHAVESALASR